MSKEPIILGIESSCDDTSAAILQGQKILSNEIANQEIHSLYGGVVPELASRAHQQNIIPVVDTAIKKANINKEDIDAIAFTKGPGLRIITSRKFIFKIVCFRDEYSINYCKSYASAHPLPLY